MNKSPRNVMSAYEHSAGTRRNKLDDVRSMAEKMWRNWRASRESLDSYLDLLYEEAFYAGKMAERETRDSSRDE